MFLLPENFTGQYKVSTGNTFSDADFQLYINKYEEKLLRDLLGATLYNLFIADLDVNEEPQTQIFIDIFDEFAEDEDAGSGIQHVSEGMIEMLKGFIYFYWLREQFTQNVISGPVKNEYSNSTQARFVETNMIDNYNQAVKTYQAIQWFIKEHLDDYPTFNGVCKSHMTWL